MAGGSSSLLSGPYLQLQEVGGDAAGAEAKQAENGEEDGDAAADDAERFRQPAHPPREGGVRVVLRLHLRLRGARSKLHEVHACGLRVVVERASLEGGGSSSKLTMDGVR